MKHDVRLALEDWRLFYAKMKALRAANPDIDNILSLKPEGEALWEELKGKLQTAKKEK